MQEPNMSQMWVRMPATLHLEASRKKREKEKNHGETFSFLTVTNSVHNILPLKRNLQI